MKSIILNLFLITAILTLTASGKTISLSYFEELLIRSNPVLLEKEKEIEILKGSLEYMREERKSSQLSVTATYFPSEEYVKEVSGYRYGLSTSIKVPVIKKSFIKKAALKALILEKEAEFFTLKRKLLTKLREAYTDYYYYSKMENLAEESINQLLIIKDVLRKRFEEKLALWSELLSVESNLIGIETTKRIFKEKKEKAFATIRELIGKPNFPHFKPVLEIRNPEEAYIPDPTEIYRDALQLKEIKLLQESFKVLRESSQKGESLLTGWFTFTGGITGKEIGDFQKGIGVSFTLSMPLNSKNLTEKLHREKILRAQRELLRAKIANYALITASQIPYRNALIYQERVKSLKASLKEKEEALKTLQLRREAGLTGGTDSYLKEALLTSELFSIKVSLLDSERKVVQALFALKGLTEKEFLRGKEQVSVSRKLHAYWWKTDNVLGNFKREIEFIKEVKKLNVGTIYMSLNEKQLNKFLGNLEGWRELERFIESAHNEGIELQLLLGENSWIFTQNRQKLLKIVNLFNRFNDYAGINGFSALHLDIEPHALPQWKTSKEKLANLYLETLNQVKDLSEKPVFVDVSPQYDRIKYDGTSLTETVLEIVDGINVMCYSTNINYLKRKASEYAQLSLKELKPVLISLSVEKELPPSQSFFKRPRVEFIKAVNMIKMEGIKSVAVQNLADFRIYLEEEREGRRKFKLVFLDAETLPEEIVVR